MQKITVVVVTRGARDWKGPDDWGHTRGVQRSSGQSVQKKAISIEGRILSRGEEDISGT